MTEGLARAEEVEVGGNEWGKSGGGKWAWIVLKTALLPKRKEAIQGYGT